VNEVNNSPLKNEHVLQASNSIHNCHLDTSEEETIRVRGVIFSQNLVYP